MDDKSKRQIEALEAIKAEPANIKDSLSLSNAWLWLIVTVLALGHACK